MLNVIWVSFFVLGFIAALVQSLYFGVSGMWSNIVGDIFTSAKTAFSISLNLTGILCLWLGLLKIAEKSANMYFEDPSHNFEYYFIDNLDREDREKRLPNGAIMPSSRDINPQRYKKFVSIYNMLAPSEPNEKESLLRMERMGLLDEKAQKRLDYIRIRESSELKNLQEKEQNGNLTDEEKIRLTQLQDQSVDILDEDEDEEE